MPLPCASKRALRRSPGTPREQLARLSLTPGRGSKLQAIPWIRNQASLSSQREGPRRSLPGQLSALPGMSTTLSITVWTVPSTVHTVCWLSAPSHPGRGSGAEWF